MAGDEIEPTMPIRSHLSVGDKPSESNTDFSTPSGQIVPDTSDCTSTNLLSSRRPVAARRIPERVGPYRIERELGRGGMGVVYLARQEGLNREIALKVLSTGIQTQPEELVRFQVEAETLAALKHPNIVQVFEVGEDDHNAYLAMEYVEGGTLAAQIDGTPQSPTEAAELLEVLARAIHFAHDKGVIHRDLKPANVLMVAGSEQSAVRDWGEEKRPEGKSRLPLHPLSSARCPLPAAKITDFGLARRLNREQNLTISGVAVGTPSYMAPEQAKGQTDKISTATDVYALGVILYEMLTGRPPFKGGTPVSTMEQVCRQEPVSPRQLQQKVPSDLETICLKCLRKEPEKRYPSAEALANDLRRFLEGRPILARPVSRIERASKWARRNPTQAALIASLVVVFALGLIGVLNQWSRAEGEWQRAEDRARDAGTAQAEAERNARQAEENAQFAKAAKEDADEARRLAEELEADLALGQGLILCEQGLIGRGLLWFARALDLAERAKVPNLVNAIRINLADWGDLFVRERILYQHRAAIRTVGFHPKSDLLAAGDYDGRIFLYDVKARKREGDLFTFDAMSFGQGQDIRHFSWNAAGTQILAGYAWGGARIWDVASGKGGRTMFHVFKHDVWATLSCADGKHCITACSDGKIRVWNSASGVTVGDPIVALPGGGYVFIALSPDGNTLVSAGSDTRLQWWNWRERKRIAGPDIRVASLVEVLTWSPDGSKLLIGTRDGAVHAWDTVTRRLIDLVPQGSSVVSAAFSPDARYFVTGTSGGDVRLWDSLSLLPITRIVRTDAAIASVSFHSSGRMLAVGDDAGIVRICEIPMPKADGAPFHIHHPAGGETHTVGFSASGDRLLTSSTSCSVVWDWRRRQVVSRFDHSTKTLAAAVSPDGKRIGTGAYYGQLAIHDVDLKLRLLETRDYLGGEVPVVLISPDGKKLFASGSNLRPKDGNACLWDISDLKKPPRRILASIASPVRSAAFSEDSRLLLIGCADRTAMLWDVDDDRHIGSLMQHASVVVAGAFSKNGEFALTGCRDGTARLWEVKTGKLVIEPLRMQGEVRAVAFSPDGSLLLTGSLDGIARFWDPKSGRPLGPGMRHPDGVRSVAFHPDGEIVATGCMDRNTQLWRVPPLPRQGSAVELRQWSEALTGFELDVKGAANPILEAELRKLRNKVGLRDQ